ncbi:hypothetical protein vseg_007958 [Gypsophila vaccaria]
MNNYPALTQITSEMTMYLEAVEKQAEERRLFQFLNGLDKEYRTLRSNILLMSPLPSVDTAVSIVLQEEAQANNTSGVKVQEMTALLSKGELEEEKCKHCGRRNHKHDECWEVIGYPIGHPRNRRPGRGIINKNSSGNFRLQNGYQAPTRFQGNFNKQFNGNNKGFKRNASAARTGDSDLTSAIEAATRQLESLLKKVPENSGMHMKCDSDEELECNFAGLY